MSHDATCIPELRITLPAHPDSLALLRHVVRGFRDAYPIAAATMDDIVLAVSEAAANAALHAYDRRPGTMTLVARVEDDRLHILVRDHGCGIQEPASTPVLGHGLSLMTHVAESIDVIGSPAGTDVVMTFDLESDPDRSSTTDDYGAVS
ncbi:MAG: serine/threonine-protein kinase RsbW [Solirubrobacteraceae bacterium]|jgi:anti-sigma regulatory factor (Ser/Thr protein kinase)|nr:serine/threonine-protein kinase RsbW [Solirubrobacteraceae bacterium]